MLPTSPNQWCPAVVRLPKETASPGQDASRGHTSRAPEPMVRRSGARASPALPGYREVLGQPPSAHSHPGLHSNVPAPEPLPDHQPTVDHLPLPHHFPPQSPALWPFDAMRLLTAYSDHLGVLGDDSVISALPWQSTPLSQCPSVCWAGSKCATVLVDERKNVFPKAFSPV